MANDTGVNVQSAGAAKHYGDENHRSRHHSTMATMQDRLREAIDAAGLGINQAGERAGLAQGELSRILKGERKKEPVASLEKLASALGISIEWLRFGTGPMQASTAKVESPPVGSANVVPLHPALRNRPKGADGRTDIEYNDRYPFRALVARSLRGVYEDEVLDAMLLEAAHGDDPGEDYWRKRAKAIWLAREKAKLEVATPPTELDFSMLGHPDD